MDQDKSTAVSGVPPAYYVGDIQQTRTSKKSKILFGYAVAVTTALIAVLVLGGVYYYRSIDLLQDTIQKFKTVDKSGDTPVTQDIEIDTASQYAVFQLSGDGVAPGTYAVLDYSKSLTGLYEPKSRRCYLIGGINNKITDLDTLRHDYEKNNSTSTSEVSGEEFSYVVADTYPVSDKTFLPGPLKTACASLPVHWLEPAPAGTHDIQKRRIGYCYWRRVRVGRFHFTIYICI